ncbi:MAG: FAD-binding protein [Armatimonadota bacterium]|nr:MAG: FAD-binding protein [Armatimonadota bacterium]
MTPDEIEHCDVLVVGAGGAGLRAAIAAYEADPGLDVLLINKGFIGASGTTALAFSDRMAFHATLPHTEPVGDDAWEYHARDIYEIGGRVSDGDLAAILAQRSQEAYEYLEALGVPFVKDEQGRARQFVTDGSEYARACYSGPDTAARIEKALLRRLGGTSVRTREGVMLADIAVGKHGAAGAVVVDTTDGRVNPIAARSIVVCTGGAGAIYRDNVYPPGMTGDGHGAAYRAGAELVNMEFIQIGLCSADTQLACSGSIMRCVPRFVNEQGEEFLATYCADLDAAEVSNVVFAKGATWPVSAEKPSRIVDIAVFGEIARRHEVYLDFSRDPEGFSWELLLPEHRERFLSEAGHAVTPGATPLARLLQINPQVVEWFAARGVDLPKCGRLRIAPAVQHFQGGIKIAANAETSVPGMFAAGECAGGQHGANRPGGNALLDTQVFGRVSGAAAAERARTIRAGDDAALIHCARSLPIQIGQGRVHAQAARRAVRKTMPRAASVVRTKAGLRDALEVIGQVARGGVGTDRGLGGAVEAVNTLTVAEMVLRAALLRDESRGPHLRFPSESDLEPLPSQGAWQRFIVIRRGENGGMTLEPRQPQPLPFVT